MNKVFLKIIIVYIILISIIAFLKFYPLGTKNAMMGASLIELEIPKLSTLESECCMYNATFKSFRSVFSLKKELDKIVKENYKLECNEGKYHYSIKDDITITRYGVREGLIMNSFFIEYEKGNLCSEEIFE